MPTTPKHATISEAIVAVQAELEPVPKTETAQYGAYASINSVLAMARPVCNRHGIAIVQSPTTVDSQPALRTRLVHASGEVLEDVMLLLLTKSDPQGQGSGITYARRYALAAMLGIEQADDDGHAASWQQRRRDPGVSETGNGPVLLNDAGRRRLMATIRDLDLDLATARRVIATYGYISTKEIPAADLQDLIGDLKGYAANPEAGDKVIAAWREKNPELAQALDEKIEADAAEVSHA